MQKSRTQAVRTEIASDKFINGRSDYRNRFSVFVYAESAYEVAVESWVGTIAHKKTAHEERQAKLPDMDSNHE